MEQLRRERALENLNRPPAKSAGIPDDDSDAAEPWPLNDED